MAVSNNIITAVNFIALMCSIPIITAGIWLSSKQDNQCIHWFRFPVIFIGILFLLVALSGFVGAYWNKPGLLSFFLFSMAFLIVFLLILLILAFTVARPSGQFSVPGRRYKEYRLAGFSQWLRDHVTDDENWHGIRACLANSKVCTKLSQEYDSAYQFFNAHLTPIESGCCKPPTICGYQYVNPTMWINPVNTVADADCSIWNNDPTQLCYSCDSCKAGLLGNLRKEWRKANVILIVAVVVLICVYLIACSAFKNAQITNLSQQHKMNGGNLKPAESFTALFRFQSELSEYIMMAVGAQVYTKEFNLDVYGIYSNVMSV